MKIVDSHCHLNMLKPEQADGLDYILRAARERGVAEFLCIGVDLDKWQEVREIAEQHDDVYATVGIHPLHPVDSLPSEEALMALADHPKVLAIGEAGLDYFYTESDEQREAQKQVFGLQLRVASKLNLPIVVHTREAREDTLELIRAYGSTQSAGVLHCFTENWEMAKAALDLGYYISFSGILTFRNADSLREVARKVPLDRVLVETDSPYLAPVPHRGKTNEPQYVVEVAQCLADLHQLPLARMAELTTTNYKALFHRA